MFWKTPNFNASICDFVTIKLIVYLTLLYPWGGYFLSLPTLENDLEHLLDSKHDPVLFLGNIIMNYIMILNITITVFYNCKFPVQEINYFYVVYR